MDRFHVPDFEVFWRAVDQGLTADCSVIVIGGAAIGMAFDPAHTTTDIDLWSNAPAEFWTACEHARQQAGKAIPIQKVGVAEAPYDFEDRLRRLPIRGLQHLQLLVPEAHDLAMMKVARGEEHDLEGILDIHRASPLDAKTLVERFRTTEVVGSREMFKLKFLDMIGRLFGEAAARAMESTL
ncbi:MAG TPA: DUF6036 family nucleotidyltransferase [Myxococcales bacterium]